MSAYPFKLIPTLEYARQLGDELRDTKLRMIALWEEQVQVGGDAYVRRPVTGPELAEAFGIRPNSVYRWKRELQKEGDSPAS